MAQRSHHRVSGGHDGRSERPATGYGEPEAGLGQAAWQHPFCYNPPMPHESSLPCEITSHRLVLPADANHHGTLYAGSLLRYALEAAYAAASRAVGPEANLMLRRVISIECRRSVPVGSLVEIRGAVVQVRQAYLAVGVVGMPLDGHTLPWMDGLLGFVQVDEAGLPVALPGTVDAVPDDAPLWQPLAKRLEKLGQVKGATAEWIGAGFGQ